MTGSHFPQQVEQWKEDKKQDEGKGQNKPPVRVDKS